MDITQKIKEGYLNYILENDQRPASVYLLAQKLEISEEEIYAQFASCIAIEKAIWLEFFESTRQKIEAEEVYTGYSVREKLLAFYYTWLETLKAHRSYVLFVYRNWNFFDFNPAYFHEFKQVFKKYAEFLMAEGRETGEVAERPYIVDMYPGLFWGQALGVLKFWMKDQSNAFEKTDAYIEKSVNFSFDAITPNALDSGFDYLKFIIQN